MPSEKTALGPIERVLRADVVGCLSECWRSPLSLSPAGYSHVSNSPGKKPRRRKSHRVAYEALIGPIPPGLTIDHLCRVRNCVNPLHMEAVTIQVNISRGDSLKNLILGHKAMGLKALAATECKRGHPYSGDNIIFRKDGRGKITRRCRACLRVAQKKVNMRRRSA